VKPVAALAAIALLAAVALVACPRGRTRDAAPEPVAEPAPVEIDWPDAGAAADAR